MLSAEYYVRGEAGGSAVDETDSSDPVDYLSRLTAAQVEVIDAVVVDADNRLTPGQLHRVRQMLARHVEAFAIDPKNPSKTHVLEVELPLQPGATPHRHSASKLGEAGREIVEKHVEEMESRGIIRKSNSPWGSRVVLVSKKDGTIRFCVDYRDLNSKLLVQDSPLPLTLEAIDRLSSGQGDQATLFLSTVDLAAGFWTLPIKEEDKPLTAFVTARQKYEFNYLPFGIQSGPSYMCRLMDAALQGLAWETCMPYLDDVGVWSTGPTAEASPELSFEQREAASFEQMLTRLDAVFERLRWAGLSMKPSKCELFGTSASYLGHVMSRDGLKMDPKKIAAVKEIDPRSVNTLERVRSFLGLCSYYRRFVAKFAHIATPLNDLCVKGVDVAEQSQSPECQDAIKRLIDSITSEPVLAPPRYDRPFIVKTDAASTEGIGGVLSQADDEGHERVIAYYGRRLNKHERRYTVTEIELLAALESIRHWRPYLWGRQFKLVIDHAALRWLHTMRDTLEGGPASRLMRWILRLSEYNFTVEHKPGIVHKDADAVSRLVAVTTVDDTKRRRAQLLTARRYQEQQRRSETKSEVVNSYLATGAPSLDVLHEEQATDEECQTYLDYLHRGHAADPVDSTELQEAARIAGIAASRSGSSGATRRERRRDGPWNLAKFDLRLVERDGVLYRIGAEGSLLPFVPLSLRDAIIASFHDHLGHASYSRTLSMIGARYYWPSLCQDVARYVGECHECTLAKRPPRRGRASRGLDVGHYPFDVLFADILDMAKPEGYDASDPHSGASKLIVFADSLSRWVEAIPLHSDPTSEQVLDIYMEHVVSRYGTPRRVVTDRGSNLASRVCQAVMQANGTDLSPSSAEHHESAGTVERFHQTLISMTRASNEGGGQWPYHLPFLLMSYRATPHRVTGYSPAMLLYGRELRLPAQMGVDSPPASTHLLEDGADAISEYALRMHRRLCFAWRAARDATSTSQGLNASETTRKSESLAFQVNDRVARKLYGNANKLEYLYAGPYRVEAVLGDGRYQLRDLENNIIASEFDVSNLRRYRTQVDAEELTADEFIVESLLDRRAVGARSQFKVKWRGYPRDQSTWVDRTELLRRCEDMVVAFELSALSSAPASASAPAPASALSLIHI